MAEESKPVNLSYATGKQKKQKTKHSALLPLDPFSLGLQLLNVRQSSQVRILFFFRTTESRTVSLQPTTTPSKKKTQWATLYLSQNTLLYHCFVPLTYKGILHRVPKKATLHRAPVLPSVLPVPAFSHQLCREKKNWKPFFYETRITETYSTRVFVDVEPTWRIAMWNVPAAERASVAWSTGERRWTAFLHSTKLKIWNHFYPIVPRR